MAEVLWQSIKVRFKLDKEWERDQVFKQMGGLWRASKSRLVSDIKKAANEEERLQLQPDNIKSVHDWNDFVKEKTSQEFKKEKSANPSSITRVKVWTRGHTKKDGTPINSKVAETINEFEKVQQDTPNSSSTNLKEDALSKVLGPDKRGHLRCFGKGVTLSKLAIFSQVNSATTQLES